MTHKLRPSLVALAIAAALSQPVSADSKHDPMIVEARANSAQTMLQIRGFNLAGASPVLTLGGLATPLQIVGVTSNQMDALLPPGIEDGTYLLTLTVKKKEKDDDGGGRGDEFWVTIGAQGPEGRAGVAGPAGATGAVGPQGPAGSGAGLVRIEQLAGIACNSENRPGACVGTIGLAFDTATRQYSIACHPVSSEPYLTLHASSANFTHVGDSLVISTDPENGLGGVIRDGDQVNRSRPFCHGTVVTVRFSRSAASASTPNVPTEIVGADSCTKTVLTRGETATCTVTMNADRTVTAN